MAKEIYRDPDLEWLDHVPPVGLVVAPTLLKELGLVPIRQNSDRQRLGWGSHRSRTLKTCADQLLGLYGAGA